MRIRSLWMAGCLGLCAAACVSAEDTPSAVKDLRVLGVQVEPSEVMLPSCDLQSANPLAQLAALPPGTIPKSLQYRALVADPAGGGRTLTYELLSCPTVSDRICEKDGERVVITRGTTTPGVLSLDIDPVATFREPLPGKDGDPLLKVVFDEDIYKGLGGLRIPLVLRVRAGDEEVYAQKLVMLSCKYFPQMQANVTPQLPGILLDEVAWGENEVPSLSGRGYSIEPMSFEALQESYTVPSFELQPVVLEERWKVAGYTTLGRLSPNETGGADLGNQSSRHRITWSPPPAGTVETPISFWFVVRDGRGGSSWLERKALYRP
jgi:hypothetical protein